MSDIVGQTSVSDVQISAGKNSSPSRADSPNHPSIRVIDQTAITLNSPGGNLGTKKRHPSTPGMPSVIGKNFCTNRRILTWMSKITDQTITNLTYEVSQLAADYLALATRLNELNHNLVSDRDVKGAKQRLDRLRSLFKGLQQQKDD
ncbi:MAG: hypothetical protein KME45_11580 [Stenomitos rutilans HA7619-LM2]|jgi:hypothetical protein|nr:hypothetical protein [Stenomitos rutilans HA7619-LM2]